MEVDYVSVQKKRRRDAISAAPTEVVGVGRDMLLQMGWEPGKGLGSTEQGRKHALRLKGCVFVA